MRNRLYILCLVSIPLATLGVCACEDASTRLQTPRVREIIRQTQLPTPPIPISKSWAAEPTGYRGVAFGTPLKDAGKRVRLRPGFKFEDGIVYSSDGRIADVKVHERWVFSGGGRGRGGFAAAWLTFDSKDYSTLYEIFVEKYGKPGLVEHKDFQTLMGVRAVNETLTWRGEKASVTLQCYNGKITEGEAFISTAAYVDAAAKRSDAKKKKAKDSF